MKELKYHLNSLKTENYPTLSASKFTTCINELVSQKTSLSRNADLSGHIMAK